MGATEYIKQLEAQNEHLQKKLSASQRLNEYHINEQQDYFECSITFKHDNKENNSVFYTDSLYWSYTDKLHENGGLANFFEKAVNEYVPNELKLLTNDITIGLYRNHRTAWRLSFHKVADDKWKLASTDLYGKNFTMVADDDDEIKVTWDELINWIGERGKKYKQNYLA